MIYMIGWDNGTNGPAGVVNELKKAASLLNMQDIEFISLSSDRKINIKKIVNLIKKNNGDVFCIHSGPCLICAFLCLISKFFKKNRYFLVVHGIYAIESKYIKKSIWYVKSCEKYIYKNFQNLICVSELCKGQISDVYGRTNNVYVIDNGYTPSTIEFNDRKELTELNIVFIGGIRRRKGIFETIELVKYLDENLHFPVNLSVYGNLYDSYYELFKEKTDGISYINYYGMIKDKNELLEIVSKYDIHFSLSYQDTFNVAIPEALSVGVPTIATNMCGASSFIIGYKNGLVVDLNSGSYREEILNYIEKYINDSNFRRSNRKFAVQSVIGKDWTSVMKNYYGVLYTTLGSDPLTKE